jgi:hypothetical protein
MAKTKLTMTKGHLPTVKLGASSLSKSKVKSPLFASAKQPGASYKKPGSEPAAMAIPSFGDTGLTGES